MRGGGICWGELTSGSTPFEVLHFYLVVPVVSGKIASRRELDINQKPQNLARCRQLDEGRIKQKLFMSTLIKTIVREIASLRALGLT